MRAPHIALLVMVAAQAGGNLTAMTGPQARIGLLGLAGVSLAKLGRRDHAHDLVEKSL